MLAMTLQGRSEWDAPGWSDLAPPSTDVLGEASPRLNWR
jgi:hypothetical protein